MIFSHKTCYFFDAVRSAAFIKSDASFFQGAKHFIEVQKSSLENSFFYLYVMSKEIEKQEKER